MLYFSLVPSALLLIAAHSAARPAPQAVRWVRYVVTALIVAFGPIGLMMLFPVVVYLALLLGVALVAWHVTRRRVRVFLPYSLTALVIAYGLAAWPAWQDYERVAALRGQYPFESLADRVPEPSPAGRLAGEAEPRSSLDYRFDLPVRDYYLAVIHDRTVEVFVNSQGFGVSRMSYSDVERHFEDQLKYREARDAPPPQPESPGPAWVLGDVQFTLPEHDRAAARKLHIDGLIDFVRPDGWGYVRSRREVAGFLPHAFSRVPEGREWKVVRVELVGLLKHPEPVVYPSDRLPAMADLKDAPTRAPDAFEAAGVAAIRKGDDGLAGRRGDEVRYVGAVRSAEACVKCHGGERGDLLGAFSYRLRPVRVP